MTLYLFALTQVIGGAAPERIDITIPQPCAPQKPESNEIVVCANPKGMSPYRINQPSPRPGARMPKAEARIADGVSVGAETENADVGGFPSNRAMVRLKLKF